MKKRLISPIIWMFFIILLTKSTFGQNPTYLCELRNDVQVSPTVFEFDIFIVRTGAIPFEYAGGQFGIIVNPLIKNGGVITPIIIPGTSDPVFVAANQNPTSIVFTDAQNAIKIAGRVPPGAGNGPIISNISPGVRVCRVQLTNTVPFGQFQPNMTWTTTLVYPTQINAYVLGLNTPVMVPSSQTTINLANFILNSATTPTITSGPSNVTVHSTGNVYTTQSGKSNYLWTVSAGGTIMGGGGLADNSVTVTWNVATPQSVSINYTDVGGPAPTPTVYPVTVNPATITVSGITAIKVYDGSLPVTLNTASALLTGVMGGDVVTLNPAGVSASFIDKIVGSGKPVTITGLFTLGGSGAGNYILTQPVITGTINPLALTITNVIANSKVYDRLTTATLNTVSASLNGVIAPDVVTLNTGGVTGSFVNKNVGNGKQVTTAGFTISGTGSGNYTVIQPNLLADITPASLTISGVTANSKLYDGNTSATLNISGATLVGVIAPDVVTLNSGSAVGTFSDPNVGTGKTVTTSGFTISGTDYLNYTLTQPVTTADIVSGGIPLTVNGVTAANKVYDGTTAATLNIVSATLVGVISPDQVTLGTTGVSGSFSDKNIGTGKTVITSGFTLSGPDAFKYVLVQPTPTANITPKAVVVTANAGQTKVYGQVDPVFTYTNSPALEIGDSFTGVLGRAAGVNVGTYAYTMGTLSAGVNYTLTMGGAATFSITPKAIVVTGNAGQTKVYGQVDPVFTYTSSPALEIGDSFTGVLGRAAGVNVGTYAYTMGTLTAGGNYTLTMGGAATFSITPKAIVITANAGQTKAYKQADPTPFNYTFAPVLEGTDVISGQMARLAGENVGTYAYTIGTLTAGSNYTLTMGGAATFSITPKAIVVTGNAGQTKIYGQVDPVFTYTNSPALEIGDSFTGVLGRSAGVNVGTYAYAIGTLSAGSNYTLTIGGAATFSITPKAVVVTANAGQTKAYGQVDPVFTYTSSPALEIGDSFTGVLGRAAGVNVGTYAYTMGTLTAGGNYTLTMGGAAIFSITPKAIVVTGNTGQTKVYGQVDPVFTYTSSPALEIGDSFTGVLGRAAGVNVGNYAYALGTLSAGSNYTLTMGGAATFSITPKAIVVTGNAGQTKIYGQVDPVFTYTNSPALEIGDSFTGVLGRSAGVNVGTYAYAIGTLSAGSNYTLTIGGAATFSITPKAVVVTANAGQTKVYGQVDPVFTYASSPALEIGDSFTGVLGRAAGVNVGTYAYTMGTLSAGGNYTLSIAGAATFSITPKAVVVTANAGQTKAYGQVDPVFTYTNSPALEIGDSFTGVLGRAAGVNVGTYAYTMGTLSAGGNYTLTMGGAATFSITPKAIVITANAGQTKAYKQADPTPFTYTFAPMLEGTDVISGQMARLAGENVGTYAYTIGTITAGGNYTLTMGGAATFSITPKAVVVTANAGQTKVYGQVDPVFTYTNSPALEIGDSFTGALGRVAGVNAGTYAYTMGTLTAGGNYTLTMGGAATFSITPKAIVVTGNAGQTKVYGQVDPVFTYTNSPALEIGDSFTGALGRAAGVNVGTYAYALGTLSAGSNYTLTMGGAATFSITPKAIVVTGNAGQTKVYGQVDPATFTYTFAPVLEGTDVISGQMARIAGENAGSYSFMIGTLNAGSNYTLSVAAINTFSISKKALTVTGVLVNNKVYDGNTTATLNTGAALLSGVISPDVVTLNAISATGTFVNKNAGTGKSVTITGLTIGGADGGNYTLTQPSALANITPAPLTITGLTVNNKVYNGNVSATMNMGGAALSGIISPDVVSLNSASASGVFANKNVGTGKPVTITGFTLGGADVSNYTLTQPSGLANITPASLTVTGMTASNKVYDGNTSAIVNSGAASLSGIISPDVVTLNSGSVTGTFANKNAGTGKSVIITGLTIGGVDGGNYTIILPATTANITPATVTINGVTANNKVYNGNVSATVNTGGAALTGIISPDVVTLNSGSAAGTFANKSVGTSKAVAITGFTIGGADGGNYSLTQPSAMADITPAALTISGVTANNKVYDGNTAVTLNLGSATLAGVISPDVVNLSSGTASGAFVDKNVGTAKTIMITGFTFGGADGGNYTLTQPLLSANITAAPLTINATNLSKAYGSEFIFTGNEYTTLGLIIGDVLPSVSISSPGAVATATVGDHVISMTGGTDPNYSISWVPGTMTVTKASLTVSADNKNRPYGSSNPALTLTYTGFKNGEDVSVIDVLPVISTTALSTSDAGSYEITLTGGSDNNYDLTAVNGTLTVEKVPLVITADNKSRMRGDPNPAFTFSYSGFVLNEDPSVLDLLPNISTTATENSDAGSYDITVTGGSDVNYMFTYVFGILTINKATQAITFTDIPSGLRMTREHTLEAVSTSGLAVSFETSDPLIASIDGNIMTVNREGTVTITAKQSGDANYNAAADVSKVVITLPTFDNVTSLFTPNNDGMNDFWYITDMEQYGKIQVIVYNRFGKSVYKSDSYMNDWDGTWNGNPLPSASYYYVIKSELKGTIYGVVNIVR